MQSENSVSICENRIRLSVVVPVFKTEATLARCLDSLICQSCFTEMEVIVVDDCSPGKPEEVLARYKQANIHLVRHDVNRGLLQARVTGSEAARGEFIAFVDSDDFVSVDFYRPMLKAADEAHADIVANTTIRQDVNGNNYQFTMHKLALPKALQGEEIRKAFFSQAGTCYAWHTIWNKIYRKSLWDQLLPYYRKIDSHVIMTEDVAFSTLLFFSAEKFVSIDVGAYYYCFTENCSTNNTKGMSFTRFKKNMLDMITVFNFTQAFLNEKSAPVYVIEGMSTFRRYYAALWNNLYEAAFARTKFAKEGQTLVRALASNSSIGKKPSAYFELNTSLKNDELENIRRKIANPDIRIVSFDIFDTLLVRPLWEPSDVFVIMQKDFERICPEHRQTKFVIYRQTAENQCRRQNGYFTNREDITITQIYVTLGEILNLSDAQTKALLELEIRTEERFLKPRRTGLQLLEFALACGKDVIYTSDMYLEEAHIRHFMDAFGYPRQPLYLSSKLGYLKGSGSLFRHILKDRHLKPEQILHIGDTWRVDCEVPSGLGLSIAFLPKARDIFSNHFAGNRTNNLFMSGCLAGGSFTTGDMMLKSLSYRCMLGLAANKLFDDPFVSWNNASDFDANPQVVGYYALGMHIAAVSVWLAELARRYETKHVVFLGRDGFLPMKAFEEMKAFNKAEDVFCTYLPCSRRALLPISIDTRHGLAHLPVSFGSHSPLSLMGLLTCCHRVPEGEYEAIIAKSNFVADSKFKDFETYANFLRWFAEHVFDQTKLNEEKALAASYYKAHIPADAIVFDLGYSGSIASSLDTCVGQHLHHAFVHEDYTSTDAVRERDGIKVDVFYDFVPMNRDIIRELVFSEPNHQCIGFEDTPNGIEPIFTTLESDYTSLFVFEQILDGALSFVRDFSEAFDGLLSGSSIKRTIASAAFEGWIATDNRTDKSIFACMKSEDAVFSNQDDINISDLWNTMPNTMAKHVMPSPPIPEDEHWKRIAKLYKHPLKIIKYKFMAKFALQKKKRSHYRNLLKFPE